MKLGLQVYSIREPLAKDPYGTLENVAGVGYKYLEMANHDAYNDDGIGFGAPLNEFKAKVDALGLKVIGAHVMPTHEMDTIKKFNRDLERWDRITDYYAALNAPYLSIPIDYFPNMDELLYRCESYNKIGELCKSKGINLLYHNHYSEYIRIEGKYIADLIAENTDPELLGIELDAYWVFRGLIDPAALIRQLGNRVKLIHQKDFPLSQVNNLSAWNFVNQDVPCDVAGFHKATRPEFFTEIGDGIIKIQDVVDAGNEVGVPYIFIEQDHSTMEQLDSIKRSYSNFQKIRGMEWE